jgi:FKBP-type peptidyl-prolyl cis-trans isomerase SlyD
MQVAENTVVDIDYTLTDDDGQVLDSSEGRGPLTYLHGVGGIIPGLERELDGKQVGDQLQVAVAPADGYGERNEALRQDVPRDQFGGVEDLDLGMQFRVDTDAGPMVLTIVAIEGDLVTIDGNHPLAGVNLNFAVTVRSVREATEEELAHGHAHGPDDHEH